MRHRNDAGSGHLIALETLVHREAEDERITLGEAPLELRKGAHDTLVRCRGVLQRLRVAFRRGFRSGPCAGRPWAAVVRGGGVVVGPFVLAADPELRHTLHSVTEHGT